METVNKKVVFIAILLAFFTAFMVYIYIKRATTSTEVVEQLNVYVAAKTMPAKYTIMDADIRQEKVTKENLNARAVLNKADIVGKRLVESVIEGEQILSDRLADEGKGTLSFNIPEGKRAVSINVNEQQNVSNLVRPGDSVDVVASFEKDETENAAGKVIMPRMTKVILENIEVLAISQDQQITDEKLKDIPKTITLAVDVEDVEKLVYISEYAVLRLALRPIDDDKEVATKGIVREDITPSKGTAIVPKQ
jgi:pilus assembly protein CpaB